MYYFCTWDMVFVCMQQETSNIVSLVFICPYVSAFFWQFDVLSTAFVLAHFLCKCESGFSVYTILRVKHFRNNFARDWVLSATEHRRHLLTIKVKMKTKRPIFLSGLLHSSAWPYFFPFPHFDWPRKIVHLFNGIAFGEIPMEKLYFNIHLYGTYYVLRTHVCK